MYARQYCTNTEYDVMYYVYEPKSNISEFWIKDKVCSGDRHVTANIYLAGRNKSDICKHYNLIRSMIVKLFV